MRSGRTPTTRTCSSCDALAWLDGFDPVHAPSAQRTPFRDGQRLHPRRTGRRRLEHNSNQSTGTTVARPEAAAAALDREPMTARRQLDLKRTSVVTIPAGLIRRLSYFGSVDGHGNGAREVA